MKRSRLVALVLCLGYGLGLLVGSAAAAPLTEVENTELYRWLVRLRKDLDYIKSAAVRGMQLKGDMIEAELIYHDKSFVNEWYLKPSVRNLLKGDEQALKPLLERADENTAGFEHDGKTVRFSDLLSKLKPFHSGLTTDWGKPSQSKVEKAHRRLFEERWREANAYLDDLYTVLRPFVPNHAEIEAAEGSAQGYGEQTPDVRYMVTTTSLLRLKLDLERLKAMSGKARGGSGLTLDNDVIEHRRSGRNSWYLQKAHLAGIAGHDVTLKKQLGEMDKQATKVEINGKAHRFADISSVLDDFPWFLEIDMGNPQRDQMDKALVKLDARIDKALAFTEGVLKKLEPLTKDYAAISRSLGMTSSDGGEQLPTWNDEATRELPLAAFDGELAAASN